MYTLKITLNWWLLVMIATTAAAAVHRPIHPFRDNIYLQAIWFSIKLFNVLLFTIEIFK